MVKAVLVGTLELSTIVQLILGDRSAKTDCANGFFVFVDLLVSYNISNKAWSKLSSCIFLGKHLLQEK